MNNRHFISQLIEPLEIPKGRILFLHVRLKDLKQQSDLSYRELTKTLLDTFQQQFEPTTILVPAYTIYAFMFARVFHLLFSKSEVGRFSEEVRQHFATHRTCDPMYSVLDTGNYLKDLPEIDYTSTLETHSLFEHLHAQNYIIINLGLKELISTQIHEAERQNQVDYRFSRKIEGTIYYDERQWEKILYRAFVRNTDEHGHSYPDWNRPKIEQFLIDQKVLHPHDHQKHRISWMASHDLMPCLNAKLKEDPHFLVT